MSFGSVVYFCSENPPSLVDDVVWRGIHSHTRRRKGTQLRAARPGSYIHLAQDTFQGIGHDAVRITELVASGKHHPVRMQGLALLHPTLAHMRSEMETNKMGIWETEKNQVLQILVENSIYLYLKPALILAFLFT